MNLVQSLNTNNLNQVGYSKVYLIYGYDLGQNIYLLKQIKKLYPHAEKYHFIDFNEFIVFYKNNQTELFNKDLFFQNEINKILEIHIGSANFTKQQLVYLSKLLKDVNDFKNIVLILLGGKLVQSVLNMPWFKLTNNIGIVIPTKPLSKQSLQNWVVEQFLKFNLTLEKNVLIQFCNLYCSDLITAEQNIYKLGVVINNDLQSIEGDNKCIISTDVFSKYVKLIQQGQKFNIFDLQRALTNKQPQIIIKILANLREQPEQELLILWGIIQETKNYLKLLSSISNEKAISLIKKKKITTLLQKAAELDLLIKGVDSFTEISLSKNKYNSNYIWGAILDLCLNFIFL